MGLKKNPNNMNQKIFIKTFGCQMNEYDSNRIYDSVKKIGFDKTDNYEEANCYLLNTCHIRDKAKEKVYHEIILVTLYVSPCFLTTKSECFIKT